MKIIGLILCGVAVLLPWVWITGLPSSEGGALISLGLGSSALVMMSLCHLLATRWRVLETIFGGLDRIYVLHKWLGIGALIGLVLHDAIDAETNGRLSNSAFSELGETLGSIGYHGVLILVLLSVATVVPYHLWRLTHRFIAVFFTFAVLHTLMVAKPFGLMDPLGLYLAMVGALGVACYIVTLVPAGMLGRERRYRVTGRRTTGGATVVTLRPERRGFRHHPGQFAFIRAPMAGAERHPFTISSAPRADGGLEFTIRPVGDGTNRLVAALLEGSEVRVSGPHGRFSPRRTKDTQIWIAAGVGITPFVAMAEALGPVGPPVELLDCVRDRTSAPHLDHLEALAASKPRLRVTVFDASRGQRLTPPAALGHASGQASKAHVFFCGPVAMREAFRRSLLSLGVRRSRFHYEAFEMRSGLGISKYALLAGRMLRAGSALWKSSRWMGRSLMAR